MKRIEDLREDNEALQKIEFVRYEHERKKE